MRSLLLLLTVAACSPGESSAPRKGCDLVGTYRLRFDARVGQWLWLRFNVDKGMKATLLPPKAISATALTVDPDPAACKLSVIAKGERGDLLASLTIDKKTNAVTGTLRGVGMRSGISIHGVRDVGPPPSKSPFCVVPGTYKLVVPPEQEWMPLESGRHCDTARVEVKFLVEYLGDKLVLDQLDPDGSAAWAAEDVFVDEADPCNVDVRFRHDEWYTYAKITFAADKVTAAATSANVEVSEHGDVWRCQIQNPMSWVEKI